MDAVVLLVARFVHSLPKVFAVSGTPRDVERIVASLRDVVVARKLERPLRVHLLRALQLLCKLQTGIISLQQLETAVAATDLAICEHHLVSDQFPLQLREDEWLFSIAALEFRRPVHGVGENLPGMNESQGERGCSEYCQVNSSV